MRYQKYGDFEVEHFDSLNEFISTISKRPTTANYTKTYGSYIECMPSHSSSGVDHGTRDWAEADGYLRNGYPEGAKAMLDEGRGIKVDEVQQRKKFAIDRVGSMPHVPNAIIGLPKNMVRRVNEPKRTKALTIYYDFAASAGVSADSLATGGRNIYATVRYLEQRGYRVQLCCMMACCESRYHTRRGNRSCYNHVAMMSVKIKDYQQAINPLMIAYPVTHPSFFRRHIFRWMETSEPTKHSEYVDGYGMPYRNYCHAYDIDIATNLCDNKVLPVGAKYVNCVDAASAKNIDDMLRLLKIAA